MKPNKKRIALINALISIAILLILFVSYLELSGSCSIPLPFGIAKVVEIPQFFTKCCTQNKLFWQMIFTHTAPSVAVITDNIIITSENRNSISAIDRNTAQTQWKFRLPGENGIHGRITFPVLADGLLFFGGTDYYFYALEAKTGQLKWEWNIEDIYPDPQTENHFTPSIVVNNTVYFGSSFGYLLALDTQTGQKRWHFDAASRISSSPALGHGLIYFGNGIGYFYALDAQTGQKRWQFLTVGARESAEAIANERWREYKPITSAPVVSEGIVYFGSSDHRLYALDALTGHEQWQFQAQDRISANPIVTQGMVLVGSADQYLHAVDALTGQERWRFQTTSTLVTLPVVMDKLVYVMDDDYVYTLDIDTGQMAWRCKITMASFLAGGINELYAN